MFEGLFQPSHLILILIVALLVFGPSKLPQIGAGLGKSIRDFKRAMADPDAGERTETTKALTEGERVETRKATTDSSTSRPN